MPARLRLRLSQMEKSAIYEYTTDSAFIRRFNGLQRDDPAKALAEHGGFIHTLAAAIEKLDPFVDTVKRGLEFLPQETLTEWTTPGKIIMPGQFMSATAADEIPDGYSDNIVLEIQSRTGKSIAGMSANELEDEVLFRWDARFRVSNRRAISGGKWYIWLAQVG